MFKIETKPFEDERKGGEKVLMTCVGIGFSNLSKTVRWSFAHEFQLKGTKINVSIDILSCTCFTQEEYVDFVRVTDFHLLMQ